MSNEFNNHEADYEVGYKKPPIHGQFKPGQSGNPKGRPKKRQTNAELMNQAFDKKMTVNVDGKKVRRTKRELFFEVVINEALKKDKTAMNIALKLLDQSEKASEFLLDENDLEDFDAFCKLTASIAKDDTDE